MSFGWTHEGENHPQIAQMTQMKDKNALNSSWYYLCNLCNLRII